MSRTLLAGLACLLLAGYGVYDYSRPATVTPAVVTEDLAKNPPAEAKEPPAEAKIPEHSGTLID